MSFFLIRELFVIYLFLFYSYFYFAIDEEFVVFIVLTLWTLFVIIFYLKTISSIFFDSMESLSSEFFFFHDKKNMILAVFRDQYYDFILLNKFLFNFFNIFKVTVNSSINNKVISVFNTSMFYLVDSLNFFKSYFKISIYFFYLSIFAHFHNILNFLVKELNLVIQLFSNNYNKIRLNVEGNHLKLLYVENFSDSTINNILSFLVSTKFKSYDFNPNLLYSKLVFENVINSSDIIVLQQVDLLKKPSISRVINRLNINMYFKNLYLYVLLREFSFIKLYK